MSHLFKLKLGMIALVVGMAACGSGSSGVDESVTAVDNNPAPQVCVVGQPDARACDPTDLKKTTVCHIPPGNPANEHTICIGNAGVPAHLAHGDHLGSCCPTTPPPPPGGTGGSGGVIGGPPAGGGGAGGAPGAGGAGGAPGTGGAGGAGGAGGTGGAGGGPPIA
jgi:hypothetical protein